MDSVVHFEIPADDVDRAQRFYEEVFGWMPKTMPDFDYVMWWTAETDDNGMLQKPGAINGGMMKRDKSRPNPVITIDVKDIDEALLKIRDYGGKILGEKMPVGEMGYSAYFIDTENNIMGLWQTKIEEVINIDDEQKDADVVLDE